ncbi:Protein-L-isoaspartate O-methyltransferase [uncultured archaeon]|nr:Protein-L-isoaspartate O-methyltransferase [uncultured archaeon]
MGDGQIIFDKNQGWVIPPPKEPAKSKEEFKKEREEKVRWLIGHGYLRSERIKDAMLKVPREDFIPPLYRDYAYLEVPLPLPGEKATISCPHSYPLFYEPLGLDKDHKFLEVGLGSGYGTALAREIVGLEGLVVSIEIDPLTFEFARKNLENLGYRDIILVKGDGGLGYPDVSPYDRICITAACIEIPPPLIEQLGIGGRLIAPVIEHGVQNLVLLEKSEKRIIKKVICEVLYIPLKGRYGVSEE